MNQRFEVKLKVTNQLAVPLTLTAVRELVRLALTSAEPKLSSVVLRVRKMKKVAAPKEIPQ